MQFIKLLRILYYGKLKLPLQQASIRQAKNASLLAYKRSNFIIHSEKTSRTFGSRTEFARQSVIWSSGDR